MFSTAEETLKSSLRSLGTEFYVNYMRHALFFRWRSIVGEKISARIRPLRLERKILFVAIESASWKSELQFHKSALIDRINRASECHLIDEIMLGRSIAPRESVPSSEQDESDAPDEIIRRALPTVTLTDEELCEIDRSLEKYEGSPLRDSFRRNSIDRKRLEKCRLEHGWHRCARCELLVPPEAVLCFDCYRKDAAEFRRALGEIIRDAPWLTYAEIYGEMQLRMPHMIDRCYPETVASVRASVVQELARFLDVGDAKQVKRLVMAYRQVPPDRLDEELIRRTLRRLRFDLPTQSEYSLL